MYISFFLIKTKKRKYSETSLFSEYSIHSKMYTLFSLSLVSFRWIWYPVGV